MRYHFNRLFDLQMVSPPCFIAITIACLKDLRKYAKRTLTMLIVQPIQSIGIKGFLLMFYKKKR